VPSLFAIIAMRMWPQNCKFSAAFPGILCTFVYNMRTYNEIERPDFTPDMISELKADEVAEMAKLYGV